MSAPAVQARLEVRGIDRLWAQIRGHGGPLTMASRMLFDALGLGLEQTYVAGAACRDFAAFERWIAATALPDADKIERYHAWLAGAPVPHATLRLFERVAALPPALSATELAQWDRDGYVVLRSAITPGEAAAAATLLWESQGARPDDPDTWDGDRQQGIFVQRFQHPALEPARRSLRVHKAFAQLWGTPDLWMSIDRMSFNAPLRPGGHFRHHRLHWDVSLALPIPFATQGILYLTDTGPDQGALELVPGFHHELAAWLAGLGDANPREVDLSDRAVTVPAAAGDLVIWRHDLPHGASPNTSDRPRLAQYINMYDPDVEPNPVWR